MGEQSPALQALPFWTSYTREPPTENIRLFLHAAVRATRRACFVASTAARLRLVCSLPWPVAVFSLDWMWTLGLFMERMRIEMDRVTNHSFIGPCNLESSETNRFASGNQGFPLQNVSQLDHAELLWITWVDTTSQENLDNRNWYGHNTEMHSFGDRHVHRLWAERLHCASSVPTASATNSQEQWIQRQDPREVDLWTNGNGWFNPQTMAFGLTNPILVLCCWYPA